MLETSDPFLDKTPFVFKTHYCFFVFLLANTLLSYTPVPLDVKIGIGIVLLLFPLILFMLRFGSFHTNDVFLQPVEYIYDPPLWIWLGIFVLAVFVRFFHIASLPVWPMWDDAYNGFCSIQQMEHWDWKLSYPCENVPPLFFWCEAIFFKVFIPSNNSLWLFSAILSTLTLFLGWWGIRQIFSRTLSFLTFLLLAFSYWPLFLGKLSIPVVMIPGWEFALFGFLARYLRSKTKKEKIINSCLLGLCSGLGFYIWILALVPVGISLLMVFAECLKLKLKTLKTDLIILFFLTLLWIPLSSDFLENLFRGHVHEYISLNPFHQNGWKQLWVSLSYLTALLWGTITTPYFNFGPLWGGIFKSFFRINLFTGTPRIVPNEKQELFLLDDWAVRHLFYPRIIIHHCGNNENLTPSAYLLRFVGLGTAVIITFLP